ncbi:hypothetical protein HDV05_007053 [Chytridiales sp. JEL 0842]|nr:hypothetical protein HDV05_007053 [Chytridiales sp. JEL 0842]
MHRDADDHNVSLKPSDQSFQQQSSAQMQSNTLSPPSPAHLPNMSSQARTPSPSRSPPREYPSMRKSSLPPKMDTASKHSLKDTNSSKEDAYVSSDLKPEQLPPWDDKHDHYALPTDQNIQMKVAHPHFDHDPAQPITKPPPIRKQSTMDSIHSFRWSSRRSSHGIERQESILSKYMTPKKSLPPNAKTKINVPRLLFFFALFSLPYILGILTLVLRDVYRAVGVRDIKLEFLTVSYDYVFGFFDFCINVTPGSDPPALNMAPAIPNRQVCMTYASYCSQTMYQQPFNNGEWIDKQFCSPLWKAAVALEVVAAVIGFGVLLVLLDNTLVWLNWSFWYHPDRHLKPEVETLRKWFKAVTLLLVFLHGATQAVAMGLLVELRLNRISWPSSLTFHFGIFTQGISWVADILFLILFMCFDRLTFFVDVDTSASRADEGDLESFGNSGEDEFDAPPPMAMVGGSRIDAIAAQIIRGDKPADS